MSTGGVLSPLLWNLVIDDLLILWEDKNGHMQAFADDVTALHTARSIDDLYGQAQDTLIEVENWATERGLRFSHMKTEIVIFTNRRRLETDAQLTFYGHTMEIKGSAKYLGIVIDSKLSWKGHIDAVTKKANCILMQCKRIMGATWGTNPRQSKWVYTAVVRPIISYGCVVWVNALDTKKNVGKLNKVQNLALKMVTGAYPGTPCRAMEAILHIPPLDIYLKGEAVKAAYRLERDGHWSNATKRKRGRVVSHVTICNGLRQEIPILEMPGDSQPPELVWDLPCEIEIQDRVAAVDEAMIGNPQEVVCFTDGSVLGGRAGAGLAFFGFDPGGQVSLPLGTGPTIFQAEVYAVTEAASLLMSAGVENKTIRIITDSQATLNALGQVNRTQKTVAECYKAVKELNSRNRVKLQWVPGHADVPGNEIADRRAKQGAETMVMGPLPMLPVPISQCKNAVKEWVIARHQEEWHNLRTCREAKKIVPRISRKLGARFESLTRNESRLALQIFTGHGNVGKYNRLTGRSITDICQKCEEEVETAEHYACRCPAYMHQRLRYFDNYEVDISAITHPDGLTKLIKFLSRTGRLMEY